MEITEGITPVELTKAEITSLSSLKSSLGNEGVSLTTLSEKIHPNIKNLFDNTVNKFTSYESRYNTDLVKTKINNLLSGETILNPDNSREVTHAVYSLANGINTIIKKIVSVCKVYSEDDPDDVSPFVLLTNPDIDQRVVIDGDIVRIRDLTPSEIIENPDIDDELKELMAILVSNDINLQRNINRFIHYISYGHHSMFDDDLNIPATAPTLGIIIDIYSDEDGLLDFLHRNVKVLTDTFRYTTKQRIKLINNIYLPMYAAGERMFKDDFISS